jgi:hypothetical protein
MTAAAIGTPAPTAATLGLPARDMLNPRSVGPEDVVAFFAKLQTIYKDYIGSVLLPEGLQVMWALAFYLKRFAALTYKPTMPSFTVNGVCGAVQADGPGAASRE